MFLLCETEIYSQLRISLKISEFSQVFFDTHRLTEPDKSAWRLESVAFQGFLDSPSVARERLLSELELAAQRYSALRKNSFGQLTGASGHDRRAGQRRPPVPIFLWSRRV